ncbi:MAG: hypothetical protein BWK78_06710, partial [Thiotrichaceae bacterium IS1]
DFSQLTAEQVALFTPEVVAGFTADQIAAIPTVAVLGFTSEQLAKITEVAVVGFTADQLSTLTDDQKANLAHPTPPVSVALTDDEVKALDAAAVGKLTPEQLKGLKPEQMALLTVENSAGLTAEQLKLLTPEQVEGLTDEVVTSLGDKLPAPPPPVAMTDDEVKALDAAAVGKLTPEQLKGLKPEQMALLTVENSAGLTAEQLKLLTPEQVEGLTDEVVTSLGDKLPAPPPPVAMTDDEVKALDAAAVGKLTPEQLKGLKPEQMALLTVENSAGLTAEQLKLLAPEQVKGLTPEVAKSLGDKLPAPPPPVAMTDDEVKALDAAAVGKLTPEQLKGLTPEQMALLTVENSAGLTAEQLKLLAPEQVEGLTDKVVESLGDKLPPPPLGEEGGSSGIDTASLTAETIAELSLEEVASLTADDIAKIPAEAVKGLTKEQIVVITIKAVIGFTAEQLANVTPEAKEGLTSEQSAEMSEEQLAALTDEAATALDENASLDDIEKAVAGLDESASPLNALIKIRLFLSIDISKLEVKFEGKHGKKRHSKEFAEELAKFYEILLPEGWKVRVEEKHGQFFVKIKIKKHHHHHFGFDFIKFVKVGFVPAIDFEADAEDGETDDDVAKQVAELPADATGALTEEQLSEEIPEKAIETLKTTNEGATIKIFLNINLSMATPETMQKFLPKDWELNSETNKVSVPTEAAKQLPTETLTPDSVAALEPEVASNFSEEQVGKLQPATVAAMPVEMFLKIQLPALKGLKAPQLGAIPVNMLKVFTIEMIVMINPAEITAGFKADQLNGVGRSKMTELFTTDQINSIMGSTPVLDDPTLDDTTLDDTTDAGDDTTDTGDDTTDTGDDTTDTGDDTTDAGDDTTDTGNTEDTQPVEVVDDSGKIEMPKVKPAFSGKINFPMVVDLSISFTFNGKAFKGGVLSLLSQTLQSLGFGDFSDFSQENGVMLVEGSGESEGIGFAFMPPTDEAIQPTEEGAEAGLVLDEDGNYVVNTNEGLAVTVEPAPKDPEALAEVVDGEVAVAEDGTTTISGDIQTADPSAEATAPTEIAGTFDPMVVPAEADAKPGVTIEGEPGVNETATVVYPDGTAQTMMPTVEDKPSLDAAVEEIVPDMVLKYRHGVIYFVIDGYQLFAIPEFKITKVTKKPAKAIINILVPGKLVEFINTKGKRQVLHIGIVGVAETVDEAPAVDETPVDTGIAEIREPIDEPVADDVPVTTDPAIAEGEPAPTGDVPSTVPPVDESTATPGAGEVPTTETDATVPAENATPAVVDEAA